jgi:predicted Zn finger-like uncharacterized protein
MRWNFWNSGDPFCLKLLLFLIHKPNDNRGRFSMIVTCDTCKTQFNLDPERLRGARSKVRCSRCGHIFLLVQEQEALIDIDLAGDMDLAEEDAPLSSPLQKPASPSAPTKTLPGKRWIIWLAILVALGAGLLGLASYLTSHPQDKAPAGLADTASVKVLDTTQPFFLENAHAGQIFVVEGEVENQSTKPISFALIEGKLFNTTNRVAITQRCYAGNAMSREELSRLNITEIQNRMMNREGKTMSNVKIPPGKRIPFVLVFHNLPELKALSDYSVEVISSKLD